MKALLDKRLNKLKAKRKELDKLGKQNTAKVKVLNKEFQELSNQFVAVDGAVQEYEEMMVEYKKGIADKEKPPNA